MIDFRYHLVSLISVFLALAVGIVLGAGPLKESIGDTLTGEVDTLRQRAADLRAELDEVSARLADSEEVFAAAADDLVAGVLEGRRVAVVELGDTAPEVVEEVTARLDAAGADVTASVRVTDGWTDPARTTFRQTLAGTLAEYLDPAPEPDAGAGATLAEALVQGLVTAVPEDPDALAEQADVLLRLLVDSELVELAAEVTVPADAVVLLVGPVDDVLVPEEEGATPSAVELDRLELREGAVRDLALASLARTGAAVVAGHDLVEGGVVAVLRTGDGTRSRVSTVTAVDTLVGQVSVPLALAERLTGGVGHYGSDDEATAPLPPRVVVPPLVREPELPEGEGGEEGTGDPAQTSDDAGAEGTAG